MTFNLETLENRKNRVAQALSTVLGNEDLVLVYSGEPIQKSGGFDQTYDFLPHPEYFWLTGSRRSYGVSAYSKKEGWVDFALLVNRDEKIWEGGRESVSGLPIEDLEKWIEKRKPQKIFQLGLPKKQLSNVSAEELALVQEAFSQVRRIKDQAEVDLIKNIALMANFGYKKLKTFIHPGVTERDIQLEYEFEVLKNGAHKMPYGTIVGAGSNAAILHAVPTSRVVKSGDLILIDAGADVDDYCVDITRVFSADGKFSSEQNTIVNLVKDAQRSSIELCRPGMEWRDVHLASAKVMAQGLKDMGILNISADEAMSTGAISVFFPHGVGHMVGLRVRDVGGPPNPNPKKYAGARLRVDMKLQEGHLMTVEPGLYFIEALLNDAETRNTFGDQINWNEALKWREFGGVRIEDDILVTTKGPQNLTEVVEK